MTMAEGIASFVVALKQDKSIVIGEYNFEVIATVEGGNTGNWKSLFKITKGARKEPNK